MNDATWKKWEKVRERGRLRYILIHGVLIWKSMEKKYLRWLEESKTGD